MKIVNNRSMIGFPYTSVPHAIACSMHTLDQAYTTYGPRKTFKAQNFIHSACLLERTPSELMGKKHINFGPWSSQKIYLVRLRFELCTPALDHSPLAKCCWGKGSSINDVTTFWIIFDTPHPIVTLLVLKP